jgi:hypothetical protein
VLLHFQALWCWVAYQVLPGQAINTLHMAVYAAGLLPALAVGCAVSAWAGRGSVPRHGPAVVALAFAVFFDYVAAWLPRIYPTGASLHLVHGSAALGVVVAIAAAARAAVLSSRRLTTVRVTAFTLAGVLALLVPALTFALSYRRSYFARDAAARGGALSRTVLRYAQFLLFPHGHGLRALATRTAVAPDADVGQVPPAGEDLWPALVRSRPTSFLILTVDAVRADAGLRHEGIVLADHRTLASTTRDALTGMFSGVRWWQNAPDLFATMRSHGFRTIAIGNAERSNPYLKANPAGSFEDEVFRPRNMEQPFAGQLTDAAIEKIGAAGDKPFLAWIHYLDPHEPYVAPGKSPKERYLGEVRRTGVEIERLLAALKQTGVLDHTLVVLTADHGESFGEHVNNFHNLTLYDEVLRVPMTIIPPGGTLRGRINHVTSAIGLSSFITGLAGVRPLPEGHPWFRPPSAPDAFAFLAVSPSSWRPVGTMAVVRGHYKLIYEWRLRSAELYDLDADPGERDNLVDRRPRIAAALATDLLGELGRTGVPID